MTMACDEVAVVFSMSMAQCECTLLMPCVVACTHGLSQSLLVAASASWRSQAPAVIHRNVTQAALSLCRALELGGETMTRVHDSRLYKSLLPLVGPLTEPAVKRIMESPTFQVSFPSCVASAFEARSSQRSLWL